MSPQTTQRQIERQIERLANESLNAVGKWFFALAVFGMASTGAIHLAEGPGRMEVPFAVCCVLAVMSAIVWRVAQRGELTERRKYLLVLPFVVSPNLLFYVSHFYSDAGAASYITGPFSFLLVLMVVMTGFLFDARFSMLSGIVTALIYLGACLLALPRFQALDLGSPVLDAELQSPAIWVIRATMLGFSGTVVGVMTIIARRLAVSVLLESQEKASISRLFGQYVSDEVKDKLIAEKSTTIGERKDVVVLFSDLRGFSSFSEGKEPEDIVAQLNDYFDRMVEAVTSHGGVVDKFIGDAIMAVFGGVVDLDNPQQAAVNAASAMRVELRALNRHFEERGLQPFDNGIGLHHGVVLQGSIGSEDRKEFTVIGDAVNTAARLESACKDFPESVLVSDTVFAALDERTRQRCTDHGSIKVKGKAEHVKVYGVRDPSNRPDWQSRTNRRVASNRSEPADAPHAEAP